MKPHLHFLRKYGLCPSPTISFCFLLKSSSFSRCCSFLLRSRSWLSWRQAPWKRPQRQPLGEEWRSNTNNFQPFPTPLSSAPFTICSHSMQLVIDRYGFFNGWCRLIGVTLYATIVFILSLFYWRQGSEFLCWRPQRRGVYIRKDFRWWQSPVAGLGRSRRALYSRR